MIKNRYECAVITGASAGLGEEFALQLAPHLDKLVLVARRENRLQELASIIRERHPQVAIAVFTVDLAVPGERESLVAELVRSGYVPDLLVNNAGLGDYGEFASADWPKLDAMLKVNIEALTHLTYLIVPKMIERGTGAVINVSSLASTLPIPDFAVYAATKAYVSSFSEALRIELREHHIRVMALCPGPVKTEFGEVARRDESSSGMPARESFYVPKQQVVAAALVGLERNQARIFPGWKIATAAMIIGAIPLALLRIALNSRPRR